jgi:hypothetical protein
MFCALLGQTHAWITLEPLSSVVASFLSLLGRSQELGSMRKRVFYRALMVCIMLSNPAIIMVVTFAFYAGVAKYELDAATVFTAVSLFNSLRAPLMMYPFIINALLSGQVRAPSFRGLSRSQWALVSRCW